MKSDMMKWLLLVLLFPLCDFVFYFLSDALGEEPATWFSAAENLPKLALAYARDSARQTGSRGRKQSAGRRKFTQRGGTAAAAFEGLWSQ